MMDTIVLQRNSEAGATSKEEVFGWNLSGGLHILGGALLITSWLSFMFSSWGDWSHMGRFYASAALCSLLCIAGTMIAKKMREAKGARMLFFLALFGVPTLFAQAGGFILSFVGKADGRYPALLEWQATSAMMVGQSTIVAAVLGAVISFTGFAVLLRGQQKSKELAMLYLLLCGMLVLPVRSAVMVSALIAVATVSIAWLLYRHLLLEDGLETLQDKLSYGLLLAPVAFLAGRTAFLYGDPILTTGVCCLSLGSLLFYAGKFKVDIGAWLQPVAVVVLSAGVALSLEGLAPFLYPRLLADFWLITLASLYLVLAPRMNVGGSILAIAGLIMLGAEYCSLYFSDGAYSTTLVFAISIVWTLYGSMMKQSYTAKFGMLLFIAAVLKQLFLVVFLIKGAASWVVLAAIGLVLVVLGSLYERYGRQMISQRQN